MPNILSAISDGLNAGGVDRIAELTNGLGSEVQNLTGLTSMFENLMSDPAALTDLVRNLDEMDLPGFNLDSGFGAALGSLQSLLPADVGNVLGPLLDGLDALERSVIGNVANVVTQSVQAAQAIYNLTQMRLLPDFPGGGTPLMRAAAPSTLPAAPASAAPVRGMGAGAIPMGAGEDEEGATAEGEEETDAAGDAAAASATLESIDRFLDVLPEQTSVHSAMEVVAKAGAKRGQLPFKIPLVDELGDMVQTLLAWEQMDAAGVQAQLNTTLQNLVAMLQSVAQGALKPVEADLTALWAAMRANDLQSVAATLQAQLTVLAQAITANDLSTTDSAVTALNGACDLHADVIQAWSVAVNRPLTQWHQGTAGMAENLEDRLAHRMQLLRPVDPLGHLLESSLPTGWADNSAAMQAFADRLDRYVAWLWDLVNRIDLKAIEEPLSAVANGAQAAVDGLDDAMVAVTMQVQSLFSDAETCIDQVRIEAVTQTVTAAIDQFGDELTAQLRALTAPIRDSVEALITGLQGSLGGFDPTTIENACQNVMTAVRDVLNNETLQQVAQTIADTITTAASRIDELSFAPVADLVIAGIEEVTEALQSIDASQLDTLLRMALDAAVELLPQDIAALTDPLVDELGRLIEEEAPLPQLRQVLQKPQEMLAFVRDYEPQTLIGNALSQPFEALLQKLQGFNPSTMLRDPVNQVLDTLKARLEENANPAQLLDPLIPLFDHLMARINALQPSALIAPIEARIQSLVDNLLEALNIDAIMEPFNALINEIQQIFNLIDRGRQILHRLSTMALGLLNPEAQFNAWIDPILEKVSLPVGDGPLNAAQAALAAAVDGLAAQALLERYDGAVATVKNALTAMNAEQLLIPAVQAFRSVSRERLAVIPGFETEKTAILAVLERCNPVQTSFAAPFQAVVQFSQRLDETRAALNAKLTTWDEQWLGPDSALAELRGLSVSGNGLRDQLEEIIQRQLVRPFSGLLNMAKPLTDGVAPIINALDRMIALLESKIENALLGEDGLGGIRDAMQGLIDRIDNFDLSFLTGALDEFFNRIKGKLQSLSPQAVRDAVDTEFKQLLDTIRLDLILPPQDPDPLDTLFNDLIEDFAALHPDKLIVQPLQQTFDQDILPLLEIFDLTSVIQALLDKLSTLDEELKTEMQRVNGAYNAMLQAVP